MYNPNIKIVIVEDEALIAQHLKKILVEFGYDIVGVFYNYQKALDKINEISFDILITDINLGNGIDFKSGIQLSQYVRQNNNCPIIFLTAFSDIDTIDKVSSVTPSAYLVKLVNIATLYANIQIAVNNFTTNRKFSSTDEEEDADYFFVKQKNSLLKIYWKHVYLLEYVKNYVKIFTTQHNGSFLVRGSLVQVLENMIPLTFKNKFIKINRSEAILKSCILIVKTTVVETSFGIFKIGKEFNKKDL
jgi:AmiR/NasT family two-component response regulator